MKHNIIHQKAIVKGSIKDIARQTNKTIVEVLSEVDMIVVFDCSSSMGAQDVDTAITKFGLTGYGGKSRWDLAYEKLQELQQKFAGKIAIISFSDEVKPSLSGTPEEPEGSTDLAGALKYIKPADGITDLKLCIICDGEPNDEGEALRIAKTFVSPIHTIYAGPAGGYGEKFMEKLANATGGRFNVSVLFESLETKISNLLTMG